ncbi:CopG family ribbon-helix-helix protein [Aliirhizobium smilacinae]|uniref:Ribbon-helix-helix protein, CopG family n=1 Tax=Aliirhizobium smilacinae TaxID=1395944 RepID=A0A5C4XRR4_9HYPH|nr:ribbon-helix-helix protein, CopG family [Rhizobium smilacinae]TNM66008.1 ribbon-helix-helix protein, CopG family [Rhizobium smilacinae]
MSEKTSHISASLPAELVERVDNLATLIEQDRAWIIQRALENYLTNEGADLQEDAAGLAELQAGKFSELDEVLKKANSIVEHAEAKRALRAR